jgi:tRNA-splicing ligase RtcB
MSNHELIENPGGVPVKAWTRGVVIDDKAADQLRNVGKLPIVYKWVAAMPDVHWGIGATIGSVIPTLEAIIPAAVGVDIGCGMMAVRTSLGELSLTGGPTAAARTTAAPGTRRRPGRRMHGRSCAGATRRSSNAIRA